MRKAWLGLAGAALLSACTESGRAPKVPVPDSSAPDTVAPDTLLPDATEPDEVQPGQIDPGRVVWRRLNRTEYRNTVRELFGSELDPGQDLPADDLGYGFDNVASVLTISPLHLELYERAARLLTDEATRPPRTEPVELVVEAEFAESTAEYGEVYDGVYLMATGGELSGPVEVPLAGRYRFDVRAWEQPAGWERAKLLLSVSGAPVAVVELVASPAVYSAVVELEAGRHHLAVEFINDFWDPSFDPPHDRNVVIDRFSLTGPEEAEDYASSAWARLVQCRPAALERSCASATVERFATRAWRRPLSVDERERLLSLFDDAIMAGFPPHEALAMPLQAALLSPHFLFKVELDRPGTTRLSGHELATRLSYFLWSSMPDTALLDAAAAGELDSDEGIRRQVTRMLDDPRAEALTTDFAGQWLYIRDVANVFPDPWLFPEFDEPLREAMTEELQRFFRSFVEQDRSMLELVTATDTWVNRRLAEHYQIDSLPGAPGDDETWVPMDVAGVNRAGLLSKAGLLSALSTPFRTSIVRRGKWTLGQLLCAEPSPPPPGVEGLLDAGEVTGARTLRERMELHKTEERCKSCHVAMDGIGFALEHFDGIGAWRTEDNGVPIDATGVLRGNAYNGPVELAGVVAADPRLPACFVDKLMIYAVGRGLVGEDQPLLDRLVDAFAARGHRFRALVELIATSEAFTHRTPEVAP